MPLSWNEIKDRAAAFANEWKETSREEAEAKPFLVEFFNVFGINRKKVATFEEPVKKLNAASGYIDLLWKGVILVEMKSKGKDLDKAFTQAMDYLQRVPQHELPKYVLVCDFDTFRLTDLEENNTVTFRLKDLVKNVQHFGFIAGYQKRTYSEQDPVNIEAAELMGKLHDQLKDIGYTGHALEVYLVRILFCLFADDTGIFEPLGLFDDYIRDRTNEDGSDVADRLATLFHVLNTPKEKRLKNLDEQLATFPYVNGKLFEEQLPPASFNRQMRNALVDCCKLNWSKISPAIFGSMFQSVMNPVERRNIGAHYTSEKNILKVIKPLFLDDLRSEFESLKGNVKRLGEFHKKLSTLRFLDPACGCGNFLVITYRELRLLEMDVLRELRKSGQGALDVRDILWIDVDQFYGIEYEEFPARIAEVAMWLMDHQMNMAVSEAFGQYFVRLPLKKAANIVHGNALRIDWEGVIPKEQLSFILGNPPFVGAKFMNDAQRDDMKAVMFDVPNYGLLDYVTAWYVKAARLIQGTGIKVAFVSTNSITQGEQVAPLWSYLLSHNVQVHFAYRTFVWKSEGKGAAAVHCVIVGFAPFDTKIKRLFVPHGDTVDEVKATTINPYLVDARNVMIANRQKPICDVPEMSTGNKPIDGGNYIFTDDEKDVFLLREPKAVKYMLPFLGAEEYINRTQRWILYLKGADPKELKSMPEVMKRVDAVKGFRESSSSAPTKKLALTPTRYHTENMPVTPFLVVPQVSSERRKYIPIGYLTPPIVCSDKLRIVPHATMYLFGVLTSAMHMAWVKSITGRLKSDFQYSVLNVYNNYPFPEQPSAKQIKAVETAAQKVLDTREQFPNASLADLYDPLTMPPALSIAHQELDKAVDLAYRAQPFPNEAKRMEFLFDLYEKYTAGLFATEKTQKRKPVVSASKAK